MADISPERRETTTSDVYCSSGVYSLIGNTSYCDDPEELAEMMEEDKEGMARYGEEAQETMRNAAGLKDRIRWFPSFMMPTCSACGSSVPVDEDAMWEDVGHDGDIHGEGKIRKKRGPQVARKRRRLGRDW